MIRLGNIVPRTYSLVLAKHSKHFSSEDTLAIGVNRMPRNFELMRQRVETKRAQLLRLRLQR